MSGISGICDLSGNPEESKGFPLVSGTSVETAPPPSFRDGLSIVLLGGTFSFPEWLTGEECYILKIIRISHKCEQDTS